MDYQEYLSHVWAIYEETLKSRDDADYEVDQAQMKKLVESYGFFTRIAENCGGTVEPFKIEPKMVNGGVTAYFTVFHLFGKELQEFCNIVGNMSALSIDSMADGDICISFNVPGVFKRKTE